MVALGSELLIYQVADTKAALLPALAAWTGPEPLTLDASELAEVDGAGLQLLVMLAHSLRERGGALRLQGCSAAVRGTLHSAGLAHWFELAQAEAA